MSTDTPTGQPAPDRPATLGEVAGSYLRLGTIAFGGPAAHLALMRAEFVERRHWVTSQELLDMIGGASLLPGPSSTQVALMLARKRRGWPGLLLGGICFIGPAMVLALGLAWGYVHYGTTVAGAGLLYGVKPVIVAVIADAVIGLGRTALKRVLLGVVAAVSLVAYLAGVGPLFVLLAAAAVVMVIEQRSRLSPHLARKHTGSLALLALGTPGHHHTPATGALAQPGAGAIFLEFLKLGAVVFGSGYVLFSYLHGDLVGSLAWITSAQLLAAVAIGQVTPGPVFTTATAVGYIIGGVPGALVATVGIFLPSFVFVAALMPALARVRRGVWGASFLDGVNAAAIALMTGVTIQLARSSYRDWLTVLSGVAAITLLLHWRVNPVWLVLGGAAVGLLHALL